MCIARSRRKIYVSLILTVLFVVDKINIVLFCVYRLKVLKIWKPCRRSDPKLNECLRESIELMRTKLANGIPELIIPPCDPLLIPEVNIKQNAGAIWVDSEYTDVIISGLSNFTLRDLHVEPAQHAFRIDLWFPMLSMKANYHMHGKVLLMPLSGNGTCTGNFSE